MRKSIIAGLTLGAALAALAVQAQAGDTTGGPSVSRSHDGRKATRIAETSAPTMRIPAHPVVRDCVHVMFPQCSRGGDGLNDGQFNQPYK
jgi:hypothetical protein